MSSATFSFQTVIDFLVKTDLWRATSDIFTVWLPRQTMRNRQIQDLVSRVIDAHGGSERWNRISSIEVKFNFSGTALVRKGHSPRYTPTAVVSTREIRTVYQGLGNGDHGDKWHYTPQKVWIEKADGTVAASRDQPNDAFIPHGVMTPWDDLHLATFTGYAFHSYITFPFHLQWSGVQSREIESHEENGETWRVLEVRYPETFPVHSTVQWYYFDTNFMLRRMDYHPLAMKRTAAHYCYDFKDFEGITIPTLRRVIGRSSNGALVDGKYPVGGVADQAESSRFLLDYIDVVVHEVE